MNAKSLYLAPVLLASAFLSLSAMPAAAQLVDSDGDTILDSVECPGGTLPDSDGDGLADCYDPDDDNDGVGTIEESVPIGDTNGDGVGDYQDTDGDGIPDYRDPDDDNDGTPTIDEIPGYSYIDEDCDGIPDYLDADEEDGPCADPDNDGLTNAQEEAIGSDPKDADTDDDTVFDGQEVEPDAVARDTDGDGLPDHADTDDDGDGIPTSVEHDPGVDTGPGLQVVPIGGWDDVDNDGIPNHIDTDSDGDGKSDHEEAFGAGAPASLTLATSGIQQVVSVTLQINDSLWMVGTDWAFPDSDGDGIPSWLDGNDVDGPKGDPDGDGLTNQREENHGSDPFDFDTDGDGADDGDERGDTDGDGIPNRLDRDDDGDGELSRDEGWWDTDGDSVPNALDFDDGYSPCNYLDFVIPDGINVVDGYCTDRDCDGIADAYESVGEVYVGGETHWFSVNPATGNWSVVWHEAGHTVQPALCDGPCGMEDYDCDLVPNCSDPDWTDGPGENGTGDPQCSLLN